MNSEYNKKLGLHPSRSYWMTRSLQQCDKPFTCPQHQLLQIPKQMCTDHYNLQWHYVYRKHCNYNHSHANDLPLQIRITYGRDLCLQYYCLPSDLDTTAAKSSTLPTEHRRGTTTTAPFPQRNSYNTYCTNIT